MKKKALITGVTGQDGAYLSRYLIQKGFKVIGTSRDSSQCNKENLKKWPEPNKQREKVPAEKHQENNWQQKQPENQPQRQAVSNMHVVIAQARLH